MRPDFDDHVFSRVGVELDERARRIVIVGHAAAGLHARNGGLAVDEHVDRREIGVPQRIVIGDERVLAGREAADREHEPAVSSTYTPSEAIVASWTSPAFHQSALSGDLSSVGPNRELDAIDREVGSASPRRRPNSRGRGLK